jgi:hypothetical protein
MTWVWYVWAWLCSVFWYAPRRWLGRLFGGVYRVERVDDEPEKASRRTLYIVEDDGRDWAAVLTCPGGCGQMLHMNLLPDSKPVWTLTVDRGGVPTLHPSVWRQEGCGCHFVLKRGRVHWC